RVLRVERETEETLLPTGEHAIPHVEEEAVSQPAAVDDANRPSLLDDIEPIALAARSGHLHRLGEPSGDHDASERARGALGAERGPGDRRESDDAECRGGDGR